VEKLFVSIQVILEERALELRGMIMVVFAGWVQTDMGQSGGRRAPVTVRDSAEGILRLVECTRVVQGHDQANTPTSPSGQYRAFEQKLQSEHCVFVGYDGALYPW
jgi:hypothetical protein